MLPNILNHLGSDGLAQLKRLATVASKQGAGDTAEDNDIPELVDNFESAVEVKEDDNKEQPQEVVD